MTTKHKKPAEERAELGNDAASEQRTAAQDVLEEDDAGAGDQDGESDEHAEQSAPAPASDAPGISAAASNKKARGDASAGWRGAPAWVVPLYVTGLILVFAGQRALSALETGSTLLTGLGVAAVLFATLARFSPKFRATGQRGSIETLMRLLSLLGVIALVLYAASTEWGQERLGIATLELEARERVLGMLSVVWIALILVATVPMLFAEASLRPMRRAERPESRRVRAAASAGLTLALAAVYGALFVFSADAAELRVDYSYFKTSGPSESTKKIAQSLQDQVKVTAFFPEVNEVKTEVQGYLNELGKSAPKLKVEVTDRLLVPKKARELKATQDGMIVLSKGKVSRSMVVGTELDDSRAKLKTLDRDFQAQLMKLARARRNVYMTVGHGELNDRGGNDQEGRSAKIIDALLKKQNYTVKELGLSHGLANQVPEDADVVMVLGPTDPFASEEVATLERYVKGGGKLLLALDPDAISTGQGVTAADVAKLAQKAEAEDQSDEPAAREAKANAEKPVETDAAASRDEPGVDIAGFGPLLGAVGLKFSPVVLAHETKHVRRRFNDSDRVMLVTSNFSSHASVSTLSRNAPRAAIVLSGAGSLEPVEKLASKRSNKIDFAVQAAPGTFGDVNRNYSRDKDSETSKSYNLAAAISKKLDGKQQDDKQHMPDSAKKDDDDPLDDLNESRVFVLSDADALSDLVLSNVPGNQFLFVDAVRWLGGEESWAGEQTTEEDVRIAHTKKEDQVWFYSTIVGAPALVFGAGIALSKRSRRRARKGKR